jgi:hypothetical protein
MLEELIAGQGVWNSGSLEPMPAFDVMLQHRLDSKNARQDGCKETG